MTTGFGPKCDSSISVNSLNDFVSGFSSASRSRNSVIPRLHLGNLLVLGDIVGLEVNLHAFNICGYAFFVGTCNVPNVAILIARCCVVEFSRDALAAV